MDNMEYLYCERKKKLQCQVYEYHFKNICYRFYAFSFRNFLAANIFFPLEVTESNRAWQNTPFRKEYS